MISYLDGSCTDIQKNEITSRAHYLNTWHSAREVCCCVTICNICYEFETKLPRVKHTLQCLIGFVCLHGLFHLGNKKTGWCITLRITGFMGLVHPPEFYKVWQSTTSQELDPFVFRWREEDTLEIVKFRWENTEINVCVQNGAECYWFKEGILWRLSRK
jgi:hypothetical protein